MIFADPNYLDTYANLIEYGANCSKLYQCNALFFFNKNVLTYSSIRAVEKVSKKFLDKPYLDFKLNYNGII